MQPLAGLTVLDFSTLLPGPLAALMLAEAGAEVIKIERPGGEDMRSFPPLWDGESAVYAMLNRGKTRLTLDLKSAADRARLEPLIKRADILIEQFRPGVMERLGLGFDAVHGLNPKLICCSISGYGAAGPRAQEAGHDINYIGATGVLALQAAEHPVVPPMLAADIAGGSFPAVINILLALRTRDRSGKGCRIDIAMTDAMFTFGWYAMALGLAAGRFPGPGELALAGGSPRYQIYPAKDGRLIACGALEQKFWDAFTRAIGLPPELADDCRDPAATRAGVARLIATKASEEWRPVFAKADCCASVIASLEEAMRDPHFVERGLFEHKLENEAGRRISALPVPIAEQFRDGRATVKRAPGKDD